jgi:MFS family permease
MLAQASAGIGVGWTFAVHEALDQSGALLGPLLVAGMVAVSGYRLGFAVLAVPGALALLAIGRLRLAVPEPAAYEQHGKPTQNADAASPAKPVPFPRRFWYHAAFTTLTMAGFSTFGVLGYHLQVRHVVTEPLIPVVYAVAMGAAAVAALASGRLYDAIGFRGLVALPLLAAIVPFLSFSTTPALIWIGALGWGAAMGVHESTMRAAVANLAPTERRGVAYGTFTAIYGLACLGGSTAIGALYGHAIHDVEWFVVTLQAAALIAFFPLVRRPGSWSNAVGP